MKALVVSCGLFPFEVFPCYFYLCILLSFLLGVILLCVICGQNKNVLEVSVAVSLYA